jgi:putative peptide zinc metalloprotease protein
VAETFPALRRNLRFVRQVQAGKVSYVVKDPTTLKYFRFGEMETAVMQLLDGTRPLSGVAERMRLEHGVTMGADGLGAFVRRLKEMGLVQRSQEERSTLLMDSLRRQRKLRLQGHGNTLLRMRFSFGDPDAVFTRLVPPLRFFWTPGFVLLSTAIFAAYFLIIGAYWERFASGISRLYTPSEFTLGFLIAIYLLTVIITIIHELGHGLTCKRFGGDVHEWGAMLLYFSPAFYCNVNDAWTFQKRSDRLWVTFAGGWIELLLAGLAAVVWLAVEPGTLISQAAFLIMILSGGVVLLINFNPLIPLDGYYALMDWLEIPNLRGRSYAYVGARFRRDILRLPVTVPAVTPREARVFLTYGILSISYITVLLTVLGLWFAGLLIGMVGGWGWLLVGYVVLRIGSRLARKSAATVRAWTTDYGAWLRRRGGWLAGAAALLGALLLAPWTVRVTGSATVEPVDAAWLRPPEAARLVALHAGEGEIVAAGAPVALLVRPELEVERARARSQIAALERDAATARAALVSDRAALRSLELQTAQALLAQLDARRGALELRAPFAARVLTPRVDERIGEHVPAGEPLIELAGLGAWRARVVLAQRDAAGLAPGSRVALRFPATPRTTWRTVAAEIAPAALGEEIVLLAPLTTTDADSLLREGMTGRARIAVQRTTVAGALWRVARRTIRNDVLL